MLDSQKILWILRVVFFLGLGFEVGDALKVPFRVNDVLPVLPSQIYWPVLNNFHSDVDMMPQYIGSLAPHNGSINWKGTYFFDNEAKIDFTDFGDRGIGGGHLSIAWQRGVIGGINKWIVVVNEGREQSPGNREARG